MLNPQDWAADSAGRPNPSSVAPTQFQRAREGGAHPSHPSSPSHCQQPKPGDPEAPRRGQSTHRRFAIRRDYPDQRLCVSEEFGERTQ